MKLVPLLKVKNIGKALTFYTTVLDFELKYPDAPVNSFCVDLIHDNVELMLTETDGVSGIPVYVYVADVDALFEKYRTRGLITPGKENSPVHESPINQTWGMREFYVTDADGNTLRFSTPLKKIESNNTEIPHDKIRIVGTRYVLAVKDLATSADYYINKLGFKTVWAQGGWHLLYRDRFVVMLGECPDDRSAFETLNHSYFAYIDVENIDAIHDELKLNNVEILSDLTDEPWGQREFSIRTIDGHRIRFGQKIK
jgi:catechol 2,3-dioxygenase-like lactoylglutathione lyase family enzyme